MSENFNCEKCNKNPQIGDKSQSYWNLCSDCSKSRDGATFCIECNRTMDMKYKDGNKWTNPLSKQWHEDTAKHKSNCPKSFCGEACETVQIKKNPSYAKDYGGGKENRDDNEDKPTDRNNNTSKCNKCQTPLYDNSGKQFSWFTNEKHGKVCHPCLEELEKQGELWDNFFITASYKYVSGSSDPGMENGQICGYCHETMLERQLHSKENDKTIVKHNCQAKCMGLFGWNECKKNKTFSLTQAYIDWMKKWDYGWWHGMCPDCRIDEVKRDAKQTNNSQKKEALKELESIVSGKENNSRERERERERERDEFPNFELRYSN